MSTIEKNLRIDIMRKRMLDKNTLNVKGGLYYNIDGSTDLYGIYTIDILPPGENGLLLTSDENEGVKYQKLNQSSFVEHSFNGSGLDPDVVLAEGEEQPDSLFEPHSIGPDHFSAGWGFSLDKFSHLVDTNHNSISWNGLNLRIEHKDTENQAGVLTLSSINKDAFCNTVETADKSNKTPSGYIPTL